MRRKRRPSEGQKTAHMVFTKGVSLFNKDDGYEWEQMTDGNWIPKNVL